MEDIVLFPRQYKQRAFEKLARDGAHRARFPTEPFRLDGRRSHRAPPANRSNWKGGENMKVKTNVKAGPNLVTVQK